jgi:hypothetical protein
MGNIFGERPLPYSIGGAFISVGDFFTDKILAGSDDQSDKHFGWKKIDGQ